MQSFWYFCNIYRNHDSYGSESRKRRRTSAKRRNGSGRGTESNVDAKSLLFLVVGVAGIVIGGDVVVDSASNIALKIGMSQTLVGLTIVSIGTSLPELVTSVVAARKMKWIWHLEMRSAPIF